MNFFRDFFHTIEGNSFFYQNFTMDQNSGSYEKETYRLSSLIIQVPSKMYKKLKESESMLCNIHKHGLAAGFKFETK